MFSTGQHLGSSPREIIWRTKASSSRKAQSCGISEEGPQFSSMSWQEYVDEHLMCDLGSGEQLQSAAILGHDGGVWAESPEFPQISEIEVRTMWWQWWLRQHMHNTPSRATLVAIIAMTPCSLAPNTHDGDSFTTSYNDTLRRSVPLSEQRRCCSPFRAVCHLPVTEAVLACACSWVSQQHTKGRIP